ncbi:DUF1566 domain-containing protein [bacterium]|nr:DUF1566 domain-containing protein [bacterium]
MRRVIVLVIFFLFSLHALTDKRVAVMEISVDSSSKQYFTAKQLEQATQYLYSKLAGKMNIINQTQLKEVYQDMIEEGREKSRKMCVDDACRIELGRNAAANYNMNTRISVFAGTCTLTVELINLRTTLSEQGSGAATEFRCNIRSLKKAINKVSSLLLGERKSTKKKRNPPVDSDADKAACSYVKEKNDIDVWKEYLAKFPNGSCSFEANIIISKSNKNSVDNYKIYEKSDAMLVKDKDTGLMWQQFHSKSRMTWFAAEKYCENLAYRNYGEFHDWRLPTISELKTVIKGCQSGSSTCKVEDSCLSLTFCYRDNSCSCPKNKGPGEKGFYWSKGVWKYRGDEEAKFWSSSRHSLVMEFFWYISFQNGGVGPYQRGSHRHYVRCVRGD